MHLVQVKPEQIKIPTQIYALEEIKSFLQIRLHHYKEIQKRLL